MIRRFNDWGEWVRFVSTGPYKSDSHSREGGKDWQGTDTFDKALTLARNGMDATDYVRAVEYVSEDISHAIQPVEYVPDFTGVYFDVGLVVAGEPEHWFQQSPIDSINRKRCRLVINNTASAGVSSEVIANRGKALFSLAASLDMAGISTSVELVYAARKGRGDLYEYWVKLKEYGSHPDYSLAAYAIGHTAAFRRLAFAAFEKDTSIDSLYPEAVATDTDSDDSTSVVYLDRMYYGESQWESDEKCLAWVRERLEAMGVQFQY